MKQIALLRTVMLIMILVIFVFAVGFSQAGEWSALGSGTNGQVLALAVSESGVIYAGGSFTTAGGAAANRVAMWNGTSWLPLGDGILNGTVYALVIDSSGNLYAGGNFNAAGTVTANKIAKWDGSEWSAVGPVDYPGISDGSAVRALVVDSSDNLYIGGEFEKIVYGILQELTVNNIVMWNDTGWHTLGLGLNDDVHALVCDNADNLYAGGYFTTADGAGVNHLAQWNGTTWSDVGGGINGYVWSLAYGGSNLYAGGRFQSAGTAPVYANNIICWDGSAWNQLESGANDDVKSLTLDGTNLYAAGDFSSVGSVSASYIAKWNGTVWSALDSGTNSDVYAVARIDTGSITAGGAFTQAGEAVVSNIARWDEPSSGGTATAMPWLNLLLLNQGE